MSNPGFLYLLINPSMEGLVKIGKTTRDPKERAKELSATTGVPTPFLLVFDAYFEDHSRAEEYVHAFLQQRGYRISSNREFFSIPVNEAIKAILDAQRMFRTKKGCPSVSKTDRIALLTQRAIKRIMRSLGGMSLEWPKRRITG